MHGPATQWADEKTSAFKTRIGIWMFLLYAIIYAGFVMVNTLDPKLMGSRIGTLNLAVIYGFGLILFAVMLAIVYNAICTAAEEQFNDEASDANANADADGGQGVD